MRLRVFIVVLSLASFVQAQSSTQTLENLLAAVRANPALQANAALLEAAEARLSAAYSPVAFSGSGRASFLDYSGLGEQDPSDLNLPERSTQLDLGLSFRPFLYGDLADLASQQAIEVARAQLGLMETLSSLEVQTVEAAIGLTLAEQSLMLAQEGAELSAELLQTTQTRYERGGANDANLRAAAQQVAQAQANVLNAEANEVVAREGLALLVGPELALSLDAVPVLQAVGGVSPDVVRAQFDVLLAKRGVASTDRAFIPTASVGYAIPLEDEKSEFTLSLESATFQPSVGFNFQDPRQSVAGQQIPDGAGEGADAFRLNGTFSVGLSLDLSVADFKNREAARAQLEAAEAGLRGVLTREPLTALTLNSDLEANRVRLELAQSAFKNAQSDLAELNIRLDAGIATDLDVAQSEFSLTEAQLNVLSAERDLAASILATYRTYAVPVSSLLLVPAADPNTSAPLEPSELEPSELEIPDTDPSTPEDQP